MSSSPISVIGNIVRDPELKFIGEGAGKLEFSVACNHNWRDQSGEWQQKTSYFDCVAWRKTAEDAARVLEKGLGVIVVGRLEQRSWDDEATGQKRSKVEVLVDDIAVLTRSIESFERRRGAGVEGEAPKKAASPARQSAASSRRQVPEEEPF